MHPALRGAVPRSSGRTVRIYGRLGIGPRLAATRHSAFEEGLAPELLPAASSLLPGGDGDVRDVWARYRALMVLHAKYLCLKNRPKCGECLMSSNCGGAAEAGRG
jgi:hypothetical protein